MENEPTCSLSSLMAPRGALADGASCASLGFSPMINTAISTAEEKYRLMLIWISDKIEGEDDNVKIDCVNTRKLNSPKQRA